LHGEATLRESSTVTFTGFESSDQTLRCLLAGSVTMVALLRQEMLILFLRLSLLISSALSESLLDRNSFDRLEQIFNVHPLSNQVLQVHLHHHKQNIIPEQHYPTREELKTILFHSKDPYENVTSISIDPKTYFSNAARSRDHIEQVILLTLKEYPRIIIEVMTLYLSPCRPSSCNRSERISDPVSFILGVD
jgi:hypothetical protein